MLVCHDSKLNSEARKWHHDSDKTQTNKLALWMILKISLRAKAGIPKTLVKQKLRLHSLYFPQNTLMLTESRGEFSHLHSIFRLRALRYSFTGVIRGKPNPRSPPSQKSEGARTPMKAAQVFATCHTSCNVTSNGRAGGKLRNKNRESELGLVLSVICP